VEVGGGVSLSRLRCLARAAKGGHFHYSEDDPKSQAKFAPPSSRDGDDVMATERVGELTRT
jgi:hypothetical protein